MRTAAQSFNGYVTKPHLRRKQRLHAQRSVEERVQAGDAASGPREEREGGLTQPADHEKNTWVSTWMGEQLAREEELEQATSRDVTNTRSANKR